MGVYFVTKIPKSCVSCECCRTKEYDTENKLDGEKFCGITDDDVEVSYYYGDGRPESCPLREITTGCININKVPYEGDYYSYVKGWDDCIDRMMSMN